MARRFLNFSSLNQVGKQGSPSIAFNHLAVGCQIARIKLTTQPRAVIQLIGDSLAQNPAKSVELVCSHGRSLYSRGCW